MFQEFVSSPYVALLVLAVLFVEGIALAIIWNRNSKGLNLSEIVSFLGAGACFAVCLYAALASMGAVWIGLSLAGAFVFHVWDLRLRWKA